MGRATGPRLPGGLSPDNLLARRRARYRPAVPTRLDHVAVAVPDLEAALDTWRDVLGLPELGQDVVEEQGVRVAFLDVGQARLELLEPTGPDTPVGRHLARRGPGIHHICLRVPDVQAALDALAARGVRLVDSAPRSGAHGTRVAFVHPKGTGGVLLELVEGF